MKNLTYQEFQEMEDYHSTGSLYKICQICRKAYRPELRTYKKKSYRIGSKPRLMIVGNWFLSKKCDNCFKQKAVEKK